MPLHLCVGKGSRGGACQTGAPLLCMVQGESLWSYLWKHRCRISKFRIIDFGLADFSEYYPQGRVDVGGPTHAVPKKGPLHISLGKFDMLLPLPMSMQQMQALPRVWLNPSAISCCLRTSNQHSGLYSNAECS
jgi:hypothetical protein